MRKYVLAVVSAVLVTVSVLFTGPAAATVPARHASGGPCAGQPAAHVVKHYLYVKGLVIVSLRCGHFTNGSGWGYRKLEAKGRWNPGTDAMIAATLESPKSITPQGTARVYLTEWFVHCNPVYRYKVVVETRKVDGGMLGVLNAFKDFR